MPHPADALIHHAIEAALWQDLADALNRLQDYGLDPITGEISPTVIDAGDAIHGGGIRAGGYRLNWTDSTWVVTSRTETGV
jgi:hypothetical protein